MKGNFFTEAIVAGAGPAGMGTALGLIHGGIRPVILEKADQIGHERRGETIRFDKEMDELLGKGFIEKQTIKKINKRTYFSHTGQNEVSRKISNPNHIISWPDFMQAMADILLKEGAEIRLSSAVTGFTQKRGRITGVTATLGGAAEEEINAKAVFSCGGHEDPASCFLEINRSKVDFPAFKQLISNYSGPDDRLEYYFHLENGKLAIATIFPRGNSEAEIILMGYAETKSDRQLTFEDFCNEHPKFANRISGASPYYALNTYIPMGGMLRPCSPKPGLVMTGDAMGHVQSRGGSGIKASFLIGYTAGRLSARAVKSGRWNRWTSLKFNRKLEKSPALSSLRKHNLLYLKLRPLLFGRIRSPRDMDKYWPLLKQALR